MFFIFCRFAQNELPLFVQKNSRCFLKRRLFGVDQFFAFSVTVAFPVDHQKEGRGQRGKGVRRGNGDPDAVQPPEERKQQDGGDLKNHGAQKRDDGGNGAVVQCREERGTVDRDRAEQETEGENQKAMQGQFQQGAVIPHEHQREGVCHGFRKKKHNHR